MIGAAVYRLRAEQSAWLPVVHGRLMHAAFFAALRELSPELSGYVHDQMNLKPFTVSELRLPQQRLRQEHGRWQIPAGTILRWRVTGLTEMMVQAIAAIPPGYQLQAGGLQLVVECMSMDPGEEADSGALGEDDLIAACLAVPKVDEITFRFLSPVSFRVDDRDYPWPLPAYVFASLADKWNQAGLPGNLDKTAIHAEAETIRPLVWQGQSQRVYFAHDRGVLAFTGTFTYDLRSLVPERQQLFLLLAQFAVFAGVGRLTGQGFGQTRITYR